MKWTLPYKKRYILFSLLLSATIGIGNNGFGQTSNDYRSAATGNWNVAATWQRYDGTIWVAAGAPPTSGSANVITIQNGHTVTVTASVSVDQVVVNAGGQVKVNTGLTLTVANGTGTDMTVDGALVNSGTVNTTGTITFNSGSTYQHARDGGTIPTATWNSASTCNITGMTTTYPGGMGQTFGNVSFNVNSGSNIEMTSSLTCQGNLSLANSGSGTLQLTNNGTSRTITVGGNMTHTTGNFVHSNNTGTGNITVQRDFIKSGVGNYRIVSSVANSSLTVNGNVSISAGTFLMSEDNGIGTLTVIGNFSQSGGTITETAGGSGSIIFNSTVTQTYAKTGGTISNTINFTVNSGSTLNVGTSLIDGSIGTFTLNSGAGIITAHTQGLSTTAGTGSIQVTGTKTFNGGANYTYNGTLAQVTGNGFSSANNLNISNTAGVALTNSASVAGTITLTAGSFSIGANTLTLNGPTIAGTPTNLSTTTSSSLVFGGTSTGVLMPSSAANLNNLTINNANGVTLTGSVTVSNTLTMTQGNITTGAFTLALSNGVVSSLTHVSGTVIGRLRRAINTTLSTDYIFPVGTAAFYRPAIMNFSSLSAGTDITAEFIATPPAGFVAYADGVVSLDNTFTEGYWRFFSAGLPAATYTLNLTGNGFISYTINEASRVTGRDDGNTTWRALGTHGSQSGNDVSRSGVTNLNTTSFDFALATGCITVSLGYGYERNITIDYTKVTGGSDLYNFPLLVNLTGQGFLQTSPTGQIFNANGFDIIFTDDAYNQLDYQLEYYNGTNGDLIAWVRIPTLSSSSNTIIKILYGNPQITTDPSVTSVWDSHYKGVWHLNNNSLNDFTFYNKAGTPYNSPTYPAGRIYNSLGLNGTDQYVEVINDPNINFVGNITVSAWVYMNLGARDQKIAGNQNNSSGGYKFGIYTNNKVEFEIRNAANTPSLNRDVAGGTVLSTGQWYYLAGISSDVLDSIKTFVNGIPERPFKKTGILGTASDNLTVGKEPFQSSYYFSGMFDELRISDEVRSNGWMRTEYNNQSSPSTFYALDVVGVSSNNLPSASICDGPITLTFGYPSGGTYSGNPYIVGDVFTPPSAGTYSITYTYIGGCVPNDVTKDIIITDSPPAPVAPNKEYCINQIAYLETTTGENIRWYSGGTLVSTANPYSTGQTAAGFYNYTVTQTINGCESTATDVTLTIFSGITINTQPQPSTICEGGDATFTVAASGYNLTYQWQEDGVNISDGGIYSGTTTPTLNLTNPGIAKNGKLYRCIVSSPCGTSPVNSNAALLTIITGLWTGVVSTDWNVPGNWYCGFIPNSTTSVQIPDVPNKPVLSSGAIGTVNNIVIDINTSLTVSGNTIQIAGTITNNGTFTADAGKIEMDGSVAQFIGADVFAGNTIMDLIINNPSGVTLQGPLNITGIVTAQNGDLSSGGFLILASTATQTALINGSGTGQVNGNVTMQRYLSSGFGYKYFSSPFQSATVNEFADDLTLGAFTFFTYDESRTSSGWVSYHNPTTNPLIPLQGYAVNFGSSAAVNTVDVTGVVNNGSLSVTLYNNNNTYTKGFNLVGNPYPSPIDWDAASGWTKTNIDDALYYFKASSTDQYGGTYSSYVGGVSSDGLATNVIPSMQGFFIHVSDGTFPVTGTLAMNNSVRITDLTHPFTKSKGVNQVPLLRLTASFSDDPVSTDPVLIYFNEKATPEFDSQLDALKLFNTDLKVPNLYTVTPSETKLSISALPPVSDNFCKVPLGLKLNKTGNIIIKIRDVEETLFGMRIYISDILAGTEHDLLPDKEFSLLLGTGEYINRFFLNLSNVTTDIEDNSPGSDLFNIYCYRGILKVEINSLPGENGTLMVYNLTGQVLFIEKVYEVGYHEFNPGVKDGIYIVSFISGTERISKKIFIQN